MVHLSVLLGLLLCGGVTAQTISSPAGNGTRAFGGDGGPPTVASLSFPAAVAGDSSGVLFIADTGNHRIRRVNAAGNSMTTLAGDGTPGFAGDGANPGSARLNGPLGLYATPDGTLYIADTGNNRVRRVNAAGSSITTVAGNGTPGFAGDDSLATAARLNGPTGVFVDSAGVLYIADTGNNRIRKVDSAGTITTVAGDGTPGFAGDDSLATAASLNGPEGVFADSAGVLYIADTGNHRIRKINSAGTITTVAGDGAPGFTGDGQTPTAARLGFPRHLWVAGDGALLVADRFNHRIRRINPGGDIVTLAGNGSPGFSGDGQAANRAGLADPGGLFLADDGALFVADSGNHRIRRIASDETRGISGDLRAAPGDQVRLLSVGFTGDGQTRIDGLVLTVKDTLGGSGLTNGDFTALQLYASDDEELDDGDDLIGQMPGSALSLGTRVFLPAGSPTVPAADQQRFFIAVALLAEDAAEGGVIQVEFSTGGLATTTGGRGSTLAANGGRVRLDIVATALVLTTPPAGITSGLPLAVQPVIEARDASGRLDRDFSDTVRVSAVGDGLVLQGESVAIDGIARFSRLTYTAAVDDESVVLRFDDTTAGAEGDLPATDAEPLTANLSNDPPVVSLPNINLREDETFSIALDAAVSDPDDTQLSFSFVSAHIEGEVDGDSLRIRPETDWFGSDTLTVTATDPFGASGSDRIAVDVRPLNDAPLSLLADTLHLGSGDTLRLDLASVTRDVDNDPAAVSWAFSPPAALDLHVEAGILHLWSAQGQDGPFLLPALLLDPGFAASRDTVTVLISAPNLPPRLSLPDTALVQGEELELDLRPYGDDPDGDNDLLRWSVDGTAHLTARIGIDGRGSLQADSSFSGGDTLTVTLIDAAGDSSSAGLAIQVLPRNTAPVFSAPAPVRLQAGDTLRLNMAPLTFDDDPAALLVWSADQPTHGRAVVQDSLLTLFSDSTLAYTDTLELRVSDPTGQHATASLLLDVFLPPPLRLVLPDTAFAAGDTLLLSLDDLVDGLPPADLSWTAEPGPGLEASIETGRRLQLTSTPGAKGPTHLVLRATDPTGHSARDTLALTLLNPPPRLLLPDELVLQAGQEHSLDLDSLATDDEPTQRLSWEAPPLIGLSVTLTVARRLVLLPAADFNGALSLPLRATDAQGATAGDTLRLRVLAAAVDTTTGDTVVVDPPDTTVTDTTVTDTTVTDTTIADTGNGTAPTNIPPRLLAPASLHLAEDGLTLQLDSLVNDDGPYPALLWRARADSGLLVTLDARRRLLSLLPEEGFSGNAALFLRVEDLFGTADSSTVDVTVVLPPEPAGPADFSGDGQVDLDDFFSLSDRMGLTDLHPDWDARFDLDGDGLVGLGDFFIFADTFAAQKR